MRTFRTSAFAVGALFTVGLCVPSLAQNVAHTKDFEAFEKAFCEASRDGQQIFVLPIEAFNKGLKVTCADGTYALRATEPSDDPGHVVMNIDPPAGVESAFDCDGKADVGMMLVAVNCLPVSSEAADHKKT